MKISQKTNDLLLRLNDFSGSKIKNINDLSFLIEIAESGKLEKEFYDIQFTAKYLNGLGKILHSNMPLPVNKDSDGNSNSDIASEAKEKITDEFRKNMQKLINDLKKFIENADEMSRNEFSSKYMTLSRESMSNLTTLIYDLSWLKKFNNRNQE